MNATERITAKAIRAYFGSHIVHFHVSSFGRLVIVDLTYQDFHPIPEVRDWMNTHIKYLWNLNVERTYSRRIERKAVKDMVDDDPELQIRMEELLFTQDFG